MIKRIFHPIGQGAFYSEQHENFNVIYDCGSKTDAKISNPVVINAFNKDEVVDILFISHFDADHVNKIAILKNHVKIKRVILPLLHEEQKNFLINFHRILKTGLIQLIKDPEKFFGHDTDIIYLQANEDNKQINDDRINIDDLNNGDQIPSGIVLHTEIFTSGKKYDWIFIPYNHAYCKRNTSLEQNLTSRGFDVQKFKTNINYTLNEIDQNIKTLKQIYRSLPKDGRDTCINENSMIVYSGIESNCIGCINYVYGSYPFKSDNTARRISCIYTGDANLNVVDLKTIFSIYWKYVGTIQIPHHGAIQNFQENVLDDMYYICPISAKKNNKHHPSSKVIAKIISQNSYPILITEDTNSEFIEKIVI